MAGGVEYIGKGDYYKGLEGLMPSGVANGVRAFRLANEGFTLKNGDLMLSPGQISEVSLLLDAAGLKSTDIRRAEWYRSQQYEIKEFYQKRTRDIQQQYADAVKEGDTETAADMRDQWMDLQAGKDNLRYMFNDSLDELKRAPLSSLLKYPKTQREREAKLQRGLPDVM
jgi:hypothetical protein